MISIYIEKESGERDTIQIPTDISLNLMEVLKGSDYPVEATCGGMALCATCHVEVLEGESFKEATEIELAMLDSLPFISPCSRLACQMPVKEEMDGLVIRLFES